ncbi:hypothetical protein MES4922_30184 [Mesorhizobium ventifaucium]|uniref:DUF393 domain-containing protein n=1 Tax=Mesorhizobium ventifaucium TaxID=666020 RepID=A0ABN8JXJ3_9HYPH|nr:hypothetical protein MES4922_30184 [Mesorhizobium ventifaucium]
MEDAGDQYVATCLKLGQRRYGWVRLCLVPGQAAGAAQRLFRNSLWRVIWWWFRGSARSKH